MSVLLITKSYEGIESKAIVINDGNLHLTTNDDGVNVGGGNDGSGMDMQSEAGAEGLMLEINGGYMVVNAEGDGLDSNCSAVMTGGTVLVNGPTVNGNGPLDYNGTFNMSGGFLVAVGSSGMAQAASEQSTQLSVLMTYPQTQAASKIIHLANSDGNTIVSFTPAKSYQSMFISSPDLKQDGSYILYSGGISTGEETDGLYKDSNYSGGTKAVDFTIAQ